MKWIYRLTLATVFLLTLLNFLSWLFWNRSITEGHLDTIVPMKILTAIYFVFFSAAIYFAAQPGKWSAILFNLFNYFVFFGCLTILSTYTLMGGAPELLKLSQTDLPVYHFPALATVLAFLGGSVGLLMRSLKKFRWAILLNGAMLTMGASGIFGYLTHQPHYYLAFAKTGTIGMALSTSICFAVLGAVSLFYRKPMAD